VEVHQLVSQRAAVMAALRATVTRTQTAAMVLHRLVGVVEPVVRLVELAAVLEGLAIPRELDQVSRTVKVRQGLHPAAAAAAATRHLRDPALTTVAVVVLVLRVASCSHIRPAETEDGEQSSRGDKMFLMKLSTAATIEVGPCLDSAGAEYTGLVIGDLRLVKAGTGAAMAASATLTHVANGHYTLVFTTGNTDTLGTLTVSCHKSTYQMPRVLMQVIPVKVYDSIVAGSDNLEVDAIQLLGTAILTPATAGTLDVNTKLLGGATVTATTSVTIPASSTLATTTGAVGSVTGNVGGNVTGSVASVVGAVGSVTGLTAANLDTTISSRASQTSLDTLDDLVDTEVGAIKTKTDQLTFTVANQIDANSLTNGGLSASATRSALGMATANLDTQIATLATPTNITAGTITTVTNLTNAATSGDLTATMKSSVTTAVPTVSQTADQVWDELLSGHTTVGSAGAGLSAAGAAGDPWSTLIPGSYGAGTAGKIVGDNVNATISSRASQTSLDTLDDVVDTEVGAIKTKTDQLVFTVANQVDSNALTGGGGLSAADTRTALGLATANLDTQIGTLATPTNITAGTITTVTNLTNAPTSGDLTSTMKASVTAAVPTVVQIQSGLATPTNITAGTITTVTNLTNAPTSGDLTSTMKSSVTTAVPTAAQNFAAVLTTALTESYAADNVAPTLAQAIMLIQQSLHEFAISSTTRTVKKLDGSTTAATFTLDSATAPTSTTRAT
jgi:hypothetical protein